MREESMDAVVSTGAFTRVLKEKGKEVLGDVLKESSRVLKSDGQAAMIFIEPKSDELVDVLEKNGRALFMSRIARFGAKLPRRQPEQGATQETTSLSPLLFRISREPVHFFHHRIQIRSVQNFVFHRWLLKHHGKGTPQKLNSRARTNPLDT
mmetsp:Transcript_2088/g.6690  ORF Transcript_2088/g.6690 Transcript_2088/m.6690 type:complete len:152 (+) Transcript_2088:144-599(+)